MTFRLPKFVDIGPITFQVIEEDLGGEDLGQCDYESSELKIQPRLKEDVCREVYFHECIEAGNIIYELNLPHRTIQILGALLAQAIKTAK